jgi:hypothetical protein
LKFDAAFGQGFLGILLQAASDQRVIGTGVQERRLTKARRILIRRLISSPRLATIRIGQILSQRLAAGWANSMPAFLPSNSSSFLLVPRLWQRQSFDARQAHASFFVFVSPNHQEPL